MVGEASSRTSAKVTSNTQKYGINGMPGLQIMTEDSARKLSPYNFCCRRGQLSRWRPAISNVLWLVTVACWVQRKCTVTETCIPLRHHTVNPGLHPDQETVQTNVWVNVNVYSVCCTEPPFTANLERNKSRHLLQRTQIADSDCF